MIEVKNISKDFIDGNKVNTVLKPTNITINKGEFVAIVGPSGSGKSTLLTIIGALQKPTLGELYINNNNVYNFNEKERSSLRFNTIGFVLQGSNLVPYLTVKEQFQLKLNQSKMKNKGDKIDEMLERLSISHIENKYPEEISGGERQRAAIGLALILEPPILLTDEPTASLDSDKAFQVVELLEKISKESETSIIMVTHDKRMLSFCDRVLEMNDGVINEIKNF
ncbi:ABC transporter ATP-binding protein [Erysipelothrix urinaevulpis]|uniref:ABC transporter ATP-binding protein n=1 Tax=Erysipelothrix urinaevulpis TaxID=2683717 RepID=UPI00135A1CE1|nr:ABC transporter ATP-binding protein [Erysipelothrix urinaevulpis]